MVEANHGTVKKVNISLGNTNHCYYLYGIEIKVMINLEINKIYLVQQTNTIKAILEGFSESGKNAFLSFVDDKGNKTGGDIVMKVNKLKKLNK